MERGTVPARTRASSRAEARRMAGGPWWRPPLLPVEAEAEDRAAERVVSAWRDGQACQGETVMTTELVSDPM